MKYEVVYSKMKKRKEWMDGELVCSKAEQTASLYKTDINGRSKKRKVAESKLLNACFQPDEEIEIQNYLVIIQCCLDEPPNKNPSPPQPKPTRVSPPQPSRPFIKQIPPSVVPPSTTNSPLSTDDLIALISAKVQASKMPLKSKPTPYPANATVLGFIDSKQATKESGESNLHPSKARPEPQANRSISDFEGQNSRRHVPQAYEQKQVSIKVPSTKRSVPQAGVSKQISFKVPKLTLKSSLGQLRLCAPSKERPRRRQAALDIKPVYELEEWKYWLKSAVLEEIQFGIDLGAANTLMAKPQAAQMYRKSHRRRSNDMHPRRASNAPDTYFLYGPVFKDNQKDDIYFVCKSKDFRNPQNVWLFVSEWHGSADNTMQVRPLSTNFNKTQVSSTWNSKTKVFVIRGPNVSHHLGMIHAVETMALDHPPITPSLLGYAPPQKPNGLQPNMKCKDVVQSSLEKWLLDLNEDQEDVLRSMARWFTSGDEDPVTLVHGIFGSGKTRLLVTAVLFLLELLDTLGYTHVKICITSATNNAVDKILLALEDAGLTEIARIGSKKVHRRIKKYTATALQTTPPRVVGITCCASAFKEMGSLFTEDNILAITFVDECFQIPEALSMLSICYADTSHVVLLGDPNQLPPVSNLNVACPDKLTFADSLYKRLQLMGKVPIVLRKQYRCHPDISTLASKLFYNAIVVNGLTKFDRPSLLANNRALVFKDTGRSRELKVRGSITNPDEQNIIVQLVRHMVQPEVGISPSTIGVIALYRAQAFSLQKRLEMFKVEASTVDAFQGQEKDIIIVSPCRNHASDFGCDKQRLNVMLTRARHHFILVGNVEGLRNNPLWQHVIRAMTPLQSL